MLDLSNEGGKKKTPLEEKNWDDAHGISDETCSVFYGSRMPLTPREAAAGEDGPHRVPQGGQRAPLACFLGLQSDCFLATSHYSLRCVQCE